MEIASALLTQRRPATDRGVKPFQLFRILKP